MIQIRALHRGLRIAAVAATALLLAACANNPSNELADGGALGGGGGVALNGAAQPGSAQDFVVNVGDRVFFDTDSSDLSAEAVATLNRQAQWLKLYPRVQVTIEGHADERGTREYNIALGARRATTARNYLISQGIAAERMQTISYGKERPVAVCNDISCWSQNRRAVTVVSSPGA
jgi:peptidoglycan-associated lipoprotein